MSIVPSNVNVVSSSTKLDTTLVTQSSGEQTHREVVVLADPKNVDSYVPVSTVYGATHVSLITRDAQLTHTNVILEAILDQMRVMNLHLSFLTEVDLTPEDVDDDN